MYCSHFGAAPGVEIPELDFRNHDFPISNFGRCYFGCTISWGLPQRVRYCNSLVPQYSSVRRRATTANLKITGKHNWGTALVQFSWNVYQDWLANTRRADMHKIHVYGLRHDRAAYNGLLDRLFCDHRPFRIPESSKISRMFIRNYLNVAWLDHTYDFFYSSGHSRSEYWDIRSTIAQYWYPFRRTPVEPI